LEVPLTVAVNTLVWPSSTVGAEGEIETETAGTVMVDEADLVVSVAEVAVTVTVKVLEGGVVGAV
jgi:RNase P/RNase MRP subunit p29